MENNSVYEVTISYRFALNKDSDLQNILNHHVKEIPGFHKELKKVEKYSLSSARKQTINIK